MKNKIRKLVYLTASLLLPLFSIWCFMVYAEGKWKDTLKFAKNWIELTRQ